MDKLNYPRFVASAIAFTAIAQAVHTLGAHAAMGYYTDPAYAPVWSTLMMPGGGAPGAGFMYTAIFFSFITALLLIYGFLWARNAMPGTAETAKACYFALFLLLVAGVPALLSMYLLINLPIALLIAWTVEAFIINLAGFTAVAKIYK